MAVTSNMHKNANPGFTAVWIALCVLWLSMVAGGCASSSVMSGSRGHGDKSISAEAFSKHVVALVAGRDIVELASLVDPVDGLTLSPYGFIDRDTAVTLQQADIVSAWTNNSTYVWGSYDGRGDPIALPIRKYFDRFVYDKAFSQTDRVAVGRVIGQGNSLVNQDEVFAGATVVEFHVPGTNPRYGGMDWASLRVVSDPESRRRVVVEGAGP